ncbi:unnamed protein product [Closterium sp. Naga37s-1]|nr:unnamed protein product [Closterium sp. Naga37s-1]
MLASEVCPIPAQNWRKDAPRAETRNSTLSSTPAAAAAAAAAAKRGAPGTGSASASAREDKTESSCDSTTRKTKQQPLVQRGNPTAAGHHKAALSVTIEDASSEDSSADFPARFETESKPVTLGEASLSSVPPFRVGVFSAQSHLRENAPFGSASPATSPTPSACSARSSVISTFSLARRSSFSSSASSSVASGGSSSSGGGGGGGGGGGHGDFTPPISRCSTLLGSASSTIDENDVPSFAARKDRDTTPSYLLSSRPKSPRQSPTDYHGDEDGGAAISRVCTAPSVADSSRSRPPRLVMERLRLGLPNRTSSLPLRGLDSPTASPANSPAANDTSGTTGMARTRMSGHSVPKCSSLASDPAPAGLHSPVSQTTWEHMRRRTVAATGVKEQGGEDLQMDGEEMRQQQHWPEEEGMGETERKSQFLAESACLNWEDVEELCHRMDIAGIRIETLDIQPVDDDNHPPSHAAKAHTGTTATAPAAAAAACNALVGRSGPVSVGKDMTRFSGEESCASAASVVALKFSGMHMCDGSVAAFPAASGIYAIYDKEGALQYMGLSRRLAASLQAHAEDLPEMCGAVKLAVVAATNKEALVEAWKAWMQEHVAGTGKVPPGNESGNSTWTTRRVKRVKPDLRIVPGPHVKLTIPLSELIEKLVKENRVVAFIKGTRTSPQCGFSHRVLTLLNEARVDYETLNVLDEDHNPGIREGIKEYSQWPTIPQVFVNGEFIGGADILEEMAQSGELKEALAAPQQQTATAAATGGLA